MLWIHVMIQVDIVYKMLTVLHGTTDYELEFNIYSYRFIKWHTEK